MMKLLEGIVAVVAGATRGGGRGIAVGLGEMGATVYCTGRSVRGAPATKGRPETIEETAEMVTARGGVGIHVQVDHTREEHVVALFNRVRDEQGRLDVLVNDVWGGDALTEWGKPFCELSPEQGRLMMERAVYAHTMTSRYGVPLMIAQNSGLVVEITDGDARVNRFYRGNLYYDLVKTAAIRLAYGMAQELQPYDVTALAVTPGFLRSEAMLDHFGVTEDHWRDAVAKDPAFAHSESPLYVGRAVAALAADADVWQKAGRSFASWDLAEEYGFTDADGRQPHFGRYFEKELDQRWEALVEAVRRLLSRKRLDLAKLDSRRSDLMLCLPLPDERTFGYEVPVDALFFGDPDRQAEAFVGRYRERAGISGSG